MRKFLVVLFASFISLFAFSQDFSNAGKEFWLAYSYHVGMVNSGGTPSMTLNITSNVTTAFTVEIYGGVTIYSGTVNANQVINVTIPNAYFVNADGKFLNRAIHVTSVSPIVVYSFITRSAASAATLCLPAPVLGKQYYAMSFDQTSNETNASSYITIVAVEDNTNVEIIPTATTKGGWAPNSVNVVALNKGEVYQVLGITTGNNGVDLSGTSVRSVASGTGGCKRIAVFSGSGKLNIGCTSGSSDNLYQQLYPATSFGKRYLTVPSYGNPNNYYRIMRPDNTATVSVNGVTVPSASFINGYYTFFNNIPNLIVSDLPISVSQYFTSQGCAGNNGNAYDPDMVILNPVEQNIDKVTLVSTNLLAGNTSGHQHHIHVVIHNTGTAVSSFKFDGNTIASSSWVTHPGDPNYAYLYLAYVSETSHSLVSDSGFNAIAYGYAATESYAYSAGTNVRDLNQKLEVNTPYGVEPTPSVCIGAPTTFKVYFPVPATATSNFDSIHWSINTTTAISPNNFPISIINPTIDSTNIRNGKPVNWYSLPTSYSFNTPGTYTVTITTYKSSNEGCGTSQDFDFQIEVSAPPNTDYLWFNPGCPLEPVAFNDQTTSTKPTYQWIWHFGDPSSGPNDSSHLKNPTHIFSGPGTYHVQYYNITTPGCVSNTITHDVIVPDLPNATISGSTTVCVNAPSPNITITGTGGQAPYEFIYDINGTIQPPVTSVGISYTLTNIPTNVVGPVTVTLHSVRNSSSAVCLRNVSGTVTVNVSPYVSMSLQSGSTNQTVCVNSPLLNNIIYNVTTGGTGVVLATGSLPPGVNGTFNAGVYTILGTPTSSGVYNFSIKPAGGCVDPAFVPLNVSITVTDNATLSLQSGTPNQPVCVNNNISQVVYLVGGGATNATVTFVPAISGVTGTYDATTHFFTILGAPTVAGVYNYTVNTVSTCVNAPPLTGTITVNSDATIALTSATATTAQTLCLNGSSITPITYDIAGSVTSVTVSPLPPGVVYNFVPGTPGKLTISGTPTNTTAGPVNYAVTIVGPCQVQSPALTGSINVQPDATISLQSGNNNQTKCINTNIDNIIYQVNGTITSVNVTGLPAGVTYTYTPGTISTPGFITITGTPPASFTYSITLTGPCQVPAAIGGTITVTPDATLTLNSAPGSLNQTVCVNNTITDIQYTIGGSATGANISFTPGPGLPPGLSLSVVGNVYKITGAPTVVSTTPVTYSFTINTTGPCVKPAGSGTIIVNPDHTLSLNAGSAASQTVCVNTAIAPISYTFGGGATGVTVAGLPAGLIFSVAGNVVTIIGSPSATGTYNIQTTGNGCVKANLGGTITVRPLPTANFSFSTPSCNTRTISFTDNSVPNVGAITGWAWTFGDGPAVDNTQNPTHVYANAGSYTVSLTVTTNNGCSNAAPFTKTVVINERPHTDFNVPALACVSDIVSFTDNSTFGTGVANAAAYKWIFGDPSSPTNIQFSKDGTHQFTTGGTYTVTHISGSQAGCLDTITHNITISSAAVADFSVANAAALCVNDTVAITNLSTIAVGNITKLEIYWDYLNAPGTVVTDNAPALNTVYKHKYPNFQTPANKPYTVLIRAFSGVSCTNDKLRIVTVNAVPKVQFNAMPDACYDATPFQITQASETGGVTGTGTYSGAGVSPTGLFSPKVAGIGTHAIKYTFTSIAGCVDTMSSNIKVLDTASAKFSYATPVCDGNAVVFKDESTAPAGVTLGGTICDMGDGATVNVAPGGTFSHTYATWGTYTVTMSAMSTYGCKSTPYTQLVTVHPIPQPAFAFGQTSVCLPNAAVSFINTSSIADNSGITYQWDFGGLASDPLNSSTAKTPPPHIYTSAGIYTVKLIVTGATGTNGSCNATAIHIVNFIHPQPKAVFVFDKPTICIGDNVTVTDKTDGLDGTVQQWFWDFGDNINANTKQVQHLYTAAQTYPVSLYIINSQGCNSDTLTQQFAVNSYPVVDAGPDRVVLEGGSATMQPVVSGNDLQYLWSPATYLNDVTLATPTANIILNDITYTLTVTGRGGCTAPPDKLFVKVLKAPKVPNTFTPNGDGINDVWSIDYLSTYPDCRVQVFTRSGQLVFESRGYKTPWDGKIKGKPLPFDTYYYILEPGNGRPPSTGYVTLVK